MHGENGLYPASCVHLMKTYVLPVLSYGLEVLLPCKTQMDILERFLRNVLKQILSLIPNAPDPAVYILSEFMPVEAQIHIKALTFISSELHK